MPLVTSPNVTSIGESGDQTSGNVVLVEGTNVTITRSGQNITFAASGGGGSGSANALAVAQVAHGFSVGNAVTPNDSGTWMKADADDVSLCAVGIVSIVTDVDNFTVVTSGYISTLSGLTAGSNYFVSQTAGAITVTEPAFPAYSYSILLAISTTTGLVLPHRGWLNGSIVDGGAFTDTASDTIDGGSFL